MRLKDKIAIVTGAGQGIGQAIALAIAREGGKLALAARTVQNLEGTQRKIHSMGGRLPRRTDGSERRGGH